MKSSEQKGVSWNKSRSRWEAKIYILGKYEYLGKFKEEQSAIDVYKKAKKNKAKTIAAIKRAEEEAESPTHISPWEKEGLTVSEWLNTTRIYPPPSLS